MARAQKIADQDPCNRPIRGPGTSPPEAEVFILMEV